MDFCFKIEFIIALSFDINFYNSKDKGINILLSAWFSIFKLHVMVEQIYKYIEEAIQFPNTVRDVNYFITNFRSEIF